MSKLGKPSCVGYFYGSKQAKPFTVNKLVSLALALAFLIAGAVSLLRLERLEITCVEGVPSSQIIYNFELTITNKYRDTVMLDIATESLAYDVQTPKPSYSVPAGEGITIPVKLHYKTIRAAQDTQKPTAMLISYQGRKESRQRIDLRGLQK
jgi:hypothetical protein